MIQSSEYPSGFRQTLYNKALYYVTRDKDGSVTDCVCFKTTYNNMGLPYFSLYKNFTLYTETETDIIWEVTDLPLPVGMSILFRVKKITPNTPAENIIVVKISGYSPSSANTTYTAFDASQPDKALFTVPDYCTKVPCTSNKSPTIRSISLPIFGEQLMF
ncbi:hypothetical protein LOD99_5817 [Oopsacas minuta]|uniref:Uncharacterized protein n=1 Tax=Oopsacas minuta TaxID=111878 RepID=A0AAV7JPP8_9METZ|nr:hypothetical protein LOD99_5817 [Oopsacas minuta]